MEEWQAVHRVIQKSLATSESQERRGELREGNLTSGPLLFRIHNFLKERLQIYKERNDETVAEE